MSFYVAWVAGNFIYEQLSDMYFLAIPQIIEDKLVSGRYPEDNFDSEDLNEF